MDTTKGRDETLSPSISHYLTNPLYKYMLHKLIKDVSAGGINAKSTTYSYRKVALQISAMIVQETSESLQRDRLMKPFLVRKLIF